MEQALTPFGKSLLPPMMSEPLLHQWAYLAKKVIIVSLQVS